MFADIAWWQQPSQSTLELESLASVLSTCARTPLSALTTLTTKLMEALLWGFLHKIQPQAPSYPFCAQMT